MRYLSAVLLFLLSVSLSAFAATTTPIENLSIGGGPADANGGASVDYTGTGLWNGNQTLYDNKYYGFGTDGDFRWKFNTSSGKLEITDASSNALGSLTDNGTTGTLSVTGQIASTVATGTAPLSVSSTTKVANLDVDKLDGADWAAPASIGSGTPAAGAFTTLTASGDLQVNGSEIGIAADTDLMSLAANSLTINGEVRPSNGMTMTGGALTISACGSQYIGGASGSGDTIVYVGGGSTGESGLMLRKQSAFRWKIYKDNDTESGLNAGSTLVIEAYDDASALIDQPISIARAANGLVSFSRPIYCTGAAEFTGQVKGSTFESSNANPTIFAGATTLTLGNVGGATTAINLNSGAINSNQATVALLATPTTVTAFGAATTLSAGAGAAATANLNFATAINANSAAINSNQATVELLATPTAVNAFRAASGVITLGAATSTFNMQAGTIRNTAVSTVALWNTTSTTINFGGAATTLNMGAGAAATGTFNFTTAINLNTDAVVSNKATVALFNTGTTMINAFNAATAINMGATGGSTYLTRIHDMQIGNVSGATSYTGIRYNGLSNTQYALVQNNAGATLLNGVGGIYFSISNVTQMTLASGQITLADAVNITADIATGTKIGTGTDQKLGFWNKTPIIQPASANQAALSLDVDVTGADTVDKTALNSDLSAIQTLVNQLRSDLVAAGLIKGAA